MAVCVCEVLECALSGYILHLLNAVTEGENVERFYLIFVVPCIMLNSEINFVNLRYTCLPERPYTALYS